MSGGLCPGGFCPDTDYYTPSDEQHYRELGFITLSMIGIGGVLYHFES